MRYLWLLPAAICLAMSSYHADRSDRVTGRKRARHLRLGQRWVFAGSLLLLPGVILTMGGLDGVV